MHGRRSYLTVSIPLRPLRVHTYTRVAHSHRDTDQRTTHEVHPPWGKTKPPATRAQSTTAHLNCETDGINRIKEQMDNSFILLLARKSIAKRKNVLVRVDIG